VEFATEEGLAEAIAQDGAEVSGRRLSIAKSAPPPPRHGHAPGRGAGPAGGRGGSGGRGHRTPGGVPYVPVSGARPSTGHQRSAVHVGDGPAHVRMPRMVPREMVPAGRGGGRAGGRSGGRAGGGAGAAAAAAAAAELPPADGKAHSNTEFRDMLLKPAAAKGGGGKPAAAVAAAADAPVAGGGGGGGGGAEAMDT
jgi:hypothetical protein